ncbi:MAG TPA: FmdB family zinc ribbon protein [Trebonia sp.]|nr:FmdB family zinc ribbon protein [Trebonia sp.]
MPTYQYVCTECGGQLEAVQKFTDEPLTVHDCGGRLRKVFSPVGIVFKGSGFYRTDSRGKEPSAASASASSKDSGSKEKGSSSSSSSSSDSSSDSSSSSSKSGGDSSSSSSASSASSSSSSSSGGSAGEKVA